jgi:ATP/maltotriose-dependent transcriptional regulator MalT
VIVGDWWQVMAETPENTSQSAPARAGERLLATKLHEPRPPKALVSRPRLVDQLEGGFGRALTLVCAPPGSGKTALLAEWSHEPARRVAWLSLDAGDNDAVRFWRHVAAALDRARPGVAEHVESLTGAAEPPSFEGLATAAINSLDADDGELLLVLDDYHVIESEAVHQSLRFLLEHAPAGLHVAVASRADPEFPLGRLRASGELTELRAVDLRFTADEAAVLLREAVGPVLDGDERNELDLARDRATEGVALCRQFLYSQALATGLSTLAWIRQVEGDPDGARSTTEEAVRVGPTSETIDLLNPVPAQWARLLLSQGDIAAAARWTAERGVGVDEEPRHVHEPAYLVLARVLLARERFDLALPLLHRLYVAATAQGRVGSVIEIQMLRALAQAAAGEDADAVAALAESLTLGHAEGYARVFLDEGPPMATLLGRLIATQSAEDASYPSVPFAYLSGLARMFERAAAGSAAGPTPKSATGVRLVTPLSDRELEVLRLMATGRQNQEIAREIYVSLNTVKKHVTHILEKLGAANRTEATSRARQLGLLSDGDTSHADDGSQSLG